MHKIIYFQNKNPSVDSCSGATYEAFIDYAFAQSDFFMLVYVNYYGKGYTSKMKKYMNDLRPYEIKRRSTPHWPGTPCTQTSNTTYKVIFYRNTPRANEILKSVSALSEWSRPSHPQDLAFFKGNECWFYSVGHERIAAIIRATNNDLDFLEEYGLANRSNANEWKHELYIYDELHLMP